MVAPSWKRAANRHARLEALEPRNLLAGDGVFISEILAKNSGALLDEDGDASDWIEIHNASSESVDLEGWVLTDDSNDLNKWKFPSTQLPSGGYQIVFASSKDRIGTGEQLHTNFKLSSTGEYLALLQPDGTVETEFAPSYPELGDDVSFGFPIEQTLLVDDANEHTYFVPSQADNSLDWTQIDFDDQAWNTASGALGYDVRTGIPNSGFEQNDLDVWETSGTVQVVDASFVPTSEGSFHALISTEGSILSRSRAESFLGLERFALDSVVGLGVQRVSVIKREVTVAAGTEISFDWNFLTNDSRFRDFAFVTVSDSNEIIKLADTRSPLINSSAALFGRETGYKTFTHTFQEAGTFVLGIGITHVESRDIDSAVLLDNLQIDGQGDAGQLYSNFVTTDLVDEMSQGQTSLWLRQEFDVTNASEISGLILQARYDDGFVAYLNGQRIDSRNAPATVSWNSSAPAVRNNRVALQFENLSLNNLSNLRNGRNVLAIQALNSVEGADDFLFEMAVIAVGSSDNEPQNLAHATPGEPNLTETFGVVERVQFSHDRGFYDEPFALTMFTDTPNATIRYTLDGTQPTANNGETYSSPVVIDSTATLRAVGIREGYRSRKISTQSFLFIDDVLTQSTTTATQKGYPRTWGRNSADYAMDRKVIGPNDQFNGKYAATIRDDLLSIPSLSLVMEPDALFDASTGIFANPEGRGEAWERATSVELIQPNGDNGFQIDAGVRIQGGISRVISQKNSLRLLFKTKYGDSKLDFPLFGPNGPEEFDSISLRASSGEHFVGIHYIRDQFLRRSEIAVGNASSYGTFMHLYVNGMYWGLYNPSQRINAQFGVNYEGGTKDEYDVYNAGDLGSEAVTAVDGTLEAWNELISRARDVRTARTQSAKTAALLRLEGRNPDGTNDPNTESYLNIDDYVNYVLVNIYAGNSDWPHRNYYMFRRRGPESEGFRFQIWDAEFSLDGGNSGMTVSGLNPVGPTIFLNDLLTSDAFRLRFADQIHKQFSPGGAFYTNQSATSHDPEHPENNVAAARYAALADEIRSPLVAETARWGDDSAIQNFGVGLFTRDENWEPVVARNLRIFFRSRSRTVLRNLTSDNLYRTPPIVEPATGKVQLGSLVSLSGTAGQTIYFTLDGTDPRSADGQVSQTAMMYSTPFAINEPMSLKTRGLTGEAWTALSEATFAINAVPASSQNLHVTEINYNPHDSIEALNEANVDNDHFEFIELQNIGAEPIDLTGVQLVRQFNKGVQFEFGVQTLAAGGSVVVVADRAAFESRYGTDVNLAIGLGDDAATWVYEGSLSNSGDSIQVVDANAAVIDAFGYNDSKTWPQRTDGQGSSLELVQLTNDKNLPSSWRASSEFGGSPGAFGQGPDGRVVVNEVLSNAAGPEPDQVELFNASNQTIYLKNWYLSDTANDFLRYQITGDLSISPGAYVSLSEDQLNFGLNASNGDELYLIEADAAGKPLRFVDHVEFDAAAEGVSFGRWPNATGRLYPMAALTLARKNTGPQTSDVVISELQTIVTSEDSSLTAGELEFVELANTTDESLDLSDWKIRGDVDFEFPVGTFVDQNQTLLVVSFDPSDRDRSNAFRENYSVPENATLLGPYRGQLPDSSGIVRLSRPLVENDPNSPFVLVDEVIYDDDSPWPINAAVSNESLHRQIANGFGLFGDRWKAATANPGTTSFAPEPQFGPADVDRICAAVHSEDSPTEYDLDGDGEVTRDDVDFLVRNRLKTGPGDVNFDGVFDSRDLTSVFQIAEYADGKSLNSTWTEGDWNCDGDFDSQDLVIAFQANPYESA